MEAIWSNGVYVVTDESMKTRKQLLKLKNYLRCVVILNRKKKCNSNTYFTS